MKELIRAFGVLACGNAALAATVAHGQGYPAKTIRLIVPYAPGGTVDMIARLIAQGLSERLGWRAVVDNRAGAGTIIGSEIVAKRPRTVEQVPRALARGCDPVAGCKRRR